MNYDYRKGRKDVALNNLGASFIESEDYSNAIKVLTRALKGCRKVVQTIERRQIRRQNKNMQEDNDDDHDDDERYYLDSWMPKRSRITRQSYYNKEISVDTFASSSSKSSSSASITRRTIIIPSVVPESKSQMVPLAIIFNLALAHHLYAVEVKNDMEMLRKAAKLYDFVLDYHLTTDTPLSTCMVFVMACLNNLGQLYRAFDDDDMSEFFFEKLLSVLMCMVDFYPPDERPCDLDEFFQNVMHLMLPSSSAVAAAA